MIDRTVFSDLVRMKAWKRIHGLNAADWELNWGSPGLTTLPSRMEQRCFLFKIQTWFE